MSLKQLSIGLIVMAILGTTSFGYAKKSTDEKSEIYDQNIILASTSEYLARYATLPVEESICDSQNLDVHEIVEFLRLTMTDPEIEAKYAVVNTRELIQNKALSGTLKEGSTIVILREDPSFIVTVDQVESAVASYFYPLVVTWEDIPGATNVESVKVDMDKVYIYGDSVVELSVKDAAFVTITTSDVKYYHDGKYMKVDGSIE